MKPLLFVGGKMHGFKIASELLRSNYKVPLIFALKEDEHEKEKFVDVIDDSFIDSKKGERLSQELSRWKEIVVLKDILSDF